VYVVAALLLCTSVRAEVTTTNAALQPDPEFQQRLKAIFEFFDKEKNANSKMTGDECEGHIVSFITNGPLSEGETVIQLALAYSKLQPPENELALEHELALRVILGHAVKRMADEDIVASIAPYYELAMSAELRETLGHCLDMASVRDGPHRPDYRAFIKYIERDKKHPPIRMVGYMFRVNPDKGLTEVHKVYGKSGTEAKSLQAAASGEWWEQIYAAEKMRQNPKLRDVELIEELKKSRSVVVRETVQEIEDVKEKEGHVSSRAQDGSGQNNKR